MTGRGLGPCGQGFARGFGYGRGRGFGRGFGWGCRWEPTKEEEKKILEAEKEEIEKRLKELEDSE
jgi:hypothetical protein